MTVRERAGRPHRGPHLVAPADPRWHRVVRRAAVVGSVVVLAVFTWFAIRGVTPRNTEFDVIAGEVHAALLGLYALGSLVAVRYDGFGGAVMFVAAILLSLLAAVEYSPWWTVAAFVLFVTPAALHLLGWRRTRSLRAVAAVGLAVVTASVVSGAAAVQVHDYYFGRTHPVSDAPDEPVDVVRWVWAGATTSRSFTVRAALADDVTDADLLVSTVAELTAPIVVPATAVDELGIASFVVDGVRPDTLYHYAVAAQGRVEEPRRGVVRTFPEGQASFTFVVASCARTGSNGAVFDAIREQEPLLYISDGDLHYGNVTTNDPGRFAELYERVLTSPAQGALYRSTSVAYVWDDHDYGGNDSDGSSPSRPAAQASYGRFVPHYPLVGGTGGIAQAFTIGRVRFVMTDGRSMRDRAPSGDEPPTMLGAVQREWLIDEVTRASADHALVVWVNASPWIAGPGSGGDSWAGFPEERRTIADAFEAAGVDDLLMVSGDAHMLAIDDGTNNRFSSSGAVGFPVLQAAPLDRPPSAKGGPYSEGVSTQPGQFGVVRVDDRGSTVEVTLEGHTWDGEVPLRHRFTVDVPGG